MQELLCYLSYTCSRDEAVYYICFQPPIGAGTNCENKATSIERSYAHCSMYRYVLCSELRQSVNLRQQGDMLPKIGCPPRVGAARAPVFLVLALERCSTRIPATAVGRCACRSCRRSWLLESDIANVTVIEIRNTAGHDNVQDAVRQM